MNTVKMVSESGKFHSQKNYFLYSVADFLLALIIHRVVQFSDNIYIVDITSIIYLMDFTGVFLGTLYSK